ncbi:hypothetical protein BD779DRAFT_1536410, partial [Infundibulicybe gibba]
MIDFRPVLQTHFDELDRYLAAYLACGAPNSRSAARQKLTCLTLQQFYELSTDVCDDLIRRKSEEKVPSLLARHKLATFPTSRFQDLCGDIHFELSRRYPGFNWEPSGRTSPSPSWASEETYVAGMPPPTRPRRGSSQDTITTLT